MPQSRYVPVQHVWTFDSTNGFMKDGVVITAGAGPYTQALPKTLIGPILVSGCSAGGGGGNGGANGTNASGGGGGGSGAGMINVPLLWKAGDTFVVTLGSAGSGGVVSGAAPTAGGDSTITNSTVAARDATFPTGISFTGTNPVGGAAGTVGTGGTSQAGGGGGNVNSGIGNIAVGGAGGASTGAAGSASSTNPGAVYLVGGSGAGGGGSGPATAGNGARGPNAGMPNSFTSLPAVGTASGNLAGGGAGGMSLFGVAGAGGGGGVGGSAPSTGYGGGGGGGGGNANGGNGAPGYFRLVMTY